MTDKLTLADISDQRAYERERPAFLQEVIALKAIRRVGLGPHITLVFENRTTILFQVQEMARAERMVTDEQIQTELDIYNPLIPDDGELSVTLFVELTSEEELRTWLPKLAGIERAIALVVGEGDQTVQVQCEVDPDHASQLTRDDVTAAVHYLRFRLMPSVAKRLAHDVAKVVSGHPNYPYEVVLSRETVASLVADWDATE